VAPSLLEPLRPKPFRGDVIAAGVVVLTTLVWVVQARFAQAWGDGVHLAYATVAWAFVTTMAVLAPMERSQPRAYQSALYATSLALALAALLDLAGVAGGRADLRPTGSNTWIFAVLAVHAAAYALRRNSSIGTLVGALSGAGAILALVALAFGDPRVPTLRWLLLGILVAAGLGAVALRDRHFRHGVALVDVTGLASLAIAATFVPGLLRLSFARSGHDAGWGWELVIVAVGFGLVAYSSVDRQPGPAYLGVANLVAFAAMTSAGVSASGATLLGWPIALAVGAAVLLAVGLRPTTPAPPPPDVDAPEPPPLPLRG
jgi:hypothetical protein